MVSLGTLLLIEDNPSDIDLTRRALEKAHVANPVVVAEDGQEALDYLFGEGAHAGRSVYDSPILILMDLKLPKVPGFEILRRLREDPRTRQQPVVILTSSKEQEDVARGYDLGVNGYVRKPVDSRQFQDAISHLGMYWLVLSELPPRPKDLAKRK
jgi:two-component system response regulator